MANFQLSYDFQNNVRDLGNVFNQIIVKDAVFSKLVTIGQPASNTKHEWLEDASTEGFKVGDIIDFEKVDGTRSTLIAKVTNVASNVQLDIAVYGGSVDENLAIGAIVFLQSRPKNEATLADADAGYEPTVEFNYTQIFDRTAKVSLTGLNVDTYGIGTKINYEVERQLQNLAYEMTIAGLRSSRVQRSASEAGTMGGLLRFLGQATGNKVLAAGGPLSEAMLNDAMELAHSNGAM
jgi:hypothetical protein